MRSYFYKFETGESMLECIEDGTPVLLCKDFLDNPGHGIYYPIVKLGECIDLFDDCGIECLAEYISKALPEHTHQCIKWNENVAPKLAFCKILYYSKTPTIKQTVYSFDDGELQTAESEKTFEKLSITSHLNTILNETHTQFIIVKISGECNIKNTRREVEDFADTNNVAIMLCFDYIPKEHLEEFGGEYDFALYNYFINHGHNICFFKQFDYKEKQAYLLEFGGIYPKRELFTLDNKLTISTNNELNDYVRLRLFFSNYRTLTKSGLLKISFYAYFKYKFAFATIKNHCLDKAKKLGIIFSPNCKKGNNNTVNVYNPECENLIKYL